MIVSGWYRSRAKLVYLLSFVLAPYAQILSQATHKTEAKLFVDHIMPQLLEHSPAHSPINSHAIPGTPHL